MIGVSGGINCAPDEDCKRCRGKMRERRSGQPCLRCKGTGFEPDVRRETPCPNCGKPIVWRFYPEYDNERWQYVVCGECASDFHLAYRLDRVISLTRADLPEGELSGPAASEAVSDAFDKLMRRG